MRTKIWAHRGASAYAPENSLEAFQLAIDLKADGIELDIYETSDGRLVIHHDNDIKRMTGGVEAKITETDFRTLRSYNFNGSYGDQFGKVLIPEFKEVLDLFQGTPMKINVELKEGSNAYLQAISAAVQEFQMEEQVIYSSFDHIKLHHMRQINPNCEIAALYSFNMMYPWIYGKMMNLTALHPDYSRIYKLRDELGIDYVKEAHAHGLQVNPWTANKEGIIRFLATIGVDHIITDYPDVALRIVNEVEKERQIRK